MKIINLRSEIREFVLQAKNEYKSTDYLHGFYSDIAKSYKAVSELDPETCTPEEVEAAVRIAYPFFRRWIQKDGSIKKYDCQECGGEFEEVVEIGEPLEIDSATAQVCKSCLQKALGLFS